MNATKIISLNLYSILFPQIYLFFSYIEMLKNNSFKFNSSILNK